MAAAFNPNLSEQVRRATESAQSPTVSEKLDPALTIAKWSGRYQRLSQKTTDTGLVDTFRPLCYFNRGVGKEFCFFIFPSQLQFNL
jgi:hypothetical protein